MLYKSALAAVLMVGVLTLQACVAPRGLAHRATRPVAILEEGPRDEQERQFIAEFIAMPVNWYGTMSRTPFGDEVSINAGDFYISGLGQKCRKGFLQDGYQGYQFAVCQNSASEEYRVVGPLLRK